MTQINGLNGTTTSDTNVSKMEPRDGDLVSWYEAMADAWGEKLNRQAERITVMSNQVGTEGKDDPKTMTMLSAEAMRMQFISNSATNATSSVGKALETLARKQ